MNRSSKIDSSTYPALRRHSDRLRVVDEAMQRVECDHAGRLRRMTRLLVGAASLLILNGVLVVMLG
jgi:hypothetical protein